GRRRGGVDLRPARARLGDPPGDLPARLPGGAGRRALRGRGLRPGEPGRRPRLRLARSADPAWVTGRASRERPGVGPAGTVVPAYGPAGPPSGSPMPPGSGGSFARPA